MNRLIESDSFETRISNMLEDGFTDTGWDSHVFYELDDLINKGFVGVMNKDSDNPTPDLPNDMPGADKIFIPNPSEVKDKAVEKVRSDIYIEKLSRIPSGGYIYPLDSTLSGYSTDLWNTSLGYKNPSGKQYVDYLSCKKNISGNAISSNSYHYYDNIFSCPQPYDKIVGTKPCYTYDGVHSFSSPSSNLLKYGKINGHLQYSWQSCIQNYNGFEFKRLKSNLVNSPDGFQIKGYSDKASIPYFKSIFIAEKDIEYTFSFYVKTSGNNCKISMPYIYQGSGDEFNSSSYTVTNEWTRIYYTSPRLVKGTEYNITFKWLEGYNDSSCDLKVCALVCEEGDIPTMYSSPNQSYITDSVTDDYHQVIALKLTDSGNIYIPNVFIYDKVQKSNKACYDMLGNIKYGYTNNGILKVGNTLTGINFSSHIGSWEHVYIKIYNDTFTYISMDNSGDMIEATVPISNFDYNIVIAKMWKSSEYIGTDVTDVTLDKYTIDIICNMVLGAYEDSGNIVTHDTIYRNLRTFVEKSENNLIFDGYFKKLSSPSMNVKYVDNDYDNETIKVQSPLFIEKNLGV